ncbi:MAG: histidine kinase [Oscillospiraceae bacterium]|nr:histidine kinase [Oscillospiraceae bacterium]
MKKSFTIISAFGGIWLAVFATVLIVLGSMLASVSVQTSLHADFVARVNAADTIIADLHKMEEVFTEYRRSWDRESYIKYMDCCTTLDNDLKVYAALSLEAKATQNYIRRIGNFNEYQRNMVSSVENNVIELYNHSGYLALSLDLHQQQAQEMAQTDLKLSSEAYEKAFFTVRLRILGIIGGLSVFAVCLCMVMASIYFNVKRSLYAIDAHFKLLSAGNWKTDDLAISGWSEFELLSQMINRMKHEINVYIQQIENKSQLEKQLSEERLLNEKQHSMLVTAQMSALRAQINPHFLFNALNMIGVTAMVDTSETVMQLVEIVGSILRYSLYSNDILTQLDEEVEIVQRYLFLQKRRFGDALTVEIRNEVEGEGYIIPSMTVQPVVENCFKHGFGNKKHLHIQLFIALYGDCLQIRVKDSGVGFHKDKAAKGNGIGLENIRRRLSLQYPSGKAKVQIDSDPGEYSAVTLYIPANKEPNDESTDC